MRRRSASTAPRSATSCARKWAASASRPPPADVFEPADPARTMPKWLVIGAIIAVIVLVVLMSWLNSRSLEQPDDRDTNAPPRAARRRRRQRQQRRRAAPGRAGAGRPDGDRAGVAPGHARRAARPILRACSSPARRYTVPPTATAPVLKTGKPEALRITVGSAVAPPVGPRGDEGHERQPASRRPAEERARSAPRPPPRRRRPPRATAPKPRRASAGPARNAAPPPSPLPPPTTNTGQ